jgi:hypothetical protein
MFLFLYCFILHSENLVFYIEFKGLKIAEVNMRHTSYENVTKDPKQKVNSIEVTALSSGLSNFFNQVVDNYYHIQADYQFLPKSYMKKINQRNLTENSESYFDHKELIGVFFEKNTTEQQTYDIEADTRDIFSSLYYLRTLNLRDDISFTVDNCGKLSRIKSTYLLTEKVTTALGDYNTNKVQISFVHKNNKEARQSDILSNNLIDTKNTLYLWFTADNACIPIKAQYKMKAFSVYWIIKQIS